MGFAFVIALGIVAAVVTTIVVIAAELLRRSAKRGLLDPLHIRRIYSQHLIAAPIVGIATVVQVALLVVFADPHFVGSAPIITGLVSTWFAYRMTGSRVVRNAYLWATIFGVLLFEIALAAAVVGVFALALVLLLVSASAVWFFTASSRREWADDQRRARLTMPNAICLTCDYALPPASADGIRTCPECGARFGKDGVG